jgi:hypothetical protein
LTGCRRIHLHLYPPIYVLNILDVLKVVDQDLIDATIQDIDTFAPPLPMQGNFFTGSPNCVTPRGFCPKFMFLKSRNTHQMWFNPKSRLLST